MIARIALAVAALAAVPARPARAGGFGIPEIGVRRTGMAAIIGRPDDPSAIYHDPAGLVLADGLQLYISGGVSLLSTQFALAPWSDTLNDGTQVSSDQYLGATPNADGRYPTIKPTRALGVIPMLAATYAVIPKKLVVGAAVFVGNATGAAFDSHSVAQYHLIDGYIVAPELVGSVAYQVTPTLALGATAGVIDMHVHGRRYFYPIVRNKDGTVTDASAIVGDHAELTLDGSALAPTWIVGAFGRPHPRVTWGATITGRVDATLSGPVKVVPSKNTIDTNGDGVPDAPDLLLGSQKTTQLLPWAIMAGASVDVSPHVEVGAEYRYWLYRQYQKQHTDVTGIFLVRTLETVKDFHDSWEASGGARVHDLAAAPGLELMAGLQYDHSPAPAKTLTLDQPSFSHVGIHSGARYTFGAHDRYRVGASYIHYVYFIPTVTDSITAPPTNFSGKGTNHIVTASLEVRL